MKKILAIVLVIVMCSGLLCACGGKTETPADVNGDTTSESAVKEELVVRYGGDWNGCVAFVDGTDKYEDLTGTVAAIARFNIDRKSGAITPFIGLNVEDTPIEDLTARFESESIVISGKWISADFKDIIMTENNGTISARIPIEKDSGSVTLVFNFRRLDDTGWTDENPGLSESQIEYCKGKSFDELAEIIGYSKSDYPEPLTAQTPTQADTTNGDSANAKAGAIIGSWEYTNGGYVYTFNSDGTGSYSAGSTVMEFTYEDDGSNVKILYTGNTSPNEFAYTVSGNTLSIEDSFGEKVEYTKK